MTEALVFFLAMLLPLTSVSFSAEAAGKKPIGEPLVLKARIEFAGSATLTAADVKFAFFPEGRRCAFAYTGPRSNRTIEFMTRMGFRTGVGSRPPGNRKALAARIKATGAKAVGAGTWHTKGGYSSVIQGNTMQETFDAIITSRLLIQKKTDLPVVFCGTGGHIGPSHFPLNRDFDRSVGYGAVYEDAHFLHIATGGPEPYMIYLGFGGERSLTLRGRYNNTMDSRRVPNELVYYQVLAAQFEGTLRRAARGQFVIFSIRDFRDADLKELADNIGEFGGKHPDIWHASPNMVVSHHYLKAKIKVQEVRAAGANAVEITLAVDRDIFVPFVLGPLSLELPKDLPVKAAFIDGVAGKVFKNKDGVYVDLPVKAALSRGLAMRFTTAAPDMTVPDTMAVTLKIRNTSDRPLKNARLSWLGSLGLNGSRGLTVSGGTERAFTLAPGAEREIKATARTVKGTRFGIMPVYAIVEGTVGGQARTFSGGFEIVVAPMLRVEMFPMNRIALRKGRYQYMEIEIANGRSSRPGGPQDKFISHKAGPCKGSVVLGLPEGMTCKPERIPFELKDNDRKTVLFKVTNNSWGKEVVYIRPLVLFEGAGEPVESIFHGTRVVRDKEKTESRALDRAGLLVYAGWNNKNGGGRFDRSVGNPNSHYYPGHSPGYSPNGVKGWCLDTLRSCQIYTTYRNIDYMAGTMLFWLRRDPGVRNELQYRVRNPKTSWRNGVGRSNAGESMIVVGGKQRTRGPGMCLRRYPGWGDDEGYLELVFKGLGNRYWYCQAEYSRARMYGWRHVAMLWSVKERRLELYLDGKLAARADPGKGPWVVVPWSNGGGGDHNLILLTTDHGHWSGTSRDELYIYNRALTPAEIAANMNRTTKE